MLKFTDLLALGDYAGFFKRLQAQKWGGGAKYLGTSTLPRAMQTSLLQSREWSH